MMLPNVSVALVVAAGTMILAATKQFVGELNPFGILGAPLMIWADDADGPVFSVDHFPVHARDVPSPATDAGDFYDVSIFAVIVRRPKAVAGDFIAGRNIGNHFRAGEPKPMKETSEHPAILS